MKACIIERFLIVLLKDLKQSKISGAVGTYANIDPFVERIGSVEKLGIRAKKCQVMAYRVLICILDYIASLALIATSMEEICFKRSVVYKNQRTRKVEEYFAKRQKVHLQCHINCNLISSENICGF